jgi:uracil-DNA glycosylase family 4
MKDLPTHLGQHSEEVEQEVENSRKNWPGVGSTQSRLVSETTPNLGSQDTTAANFIVLGMAPGRVEDGKGVPFVGPAGTLLRNELRRTGVNPALAYYMNVVCCWPPDNNPKATHIDACRGNLKDQLEVADAELVLVCGNVAMETLIPHATPHTRATVIPIHKKRIFGIHHPSYILRAKDSAIYKRWQSDLWVFRMLLNEGNVFEAGRCIYCGEEWMKGAPPGWPPVCRDKACIRKWKVDSKWRYSPPPQLRLDL